MKRWDLSSDSHKPAAPDLGELLMHHVQRHFPLHPRPYDYLAQLFEVSEQEVLATLGALKDDGLITRVGPVFEHRLVGASSLVAQAIAPDQLDRVAAIVSGFDCVNHNYSRENPLNLWFVVTAANARELQHNLAAIEAATGYPLLALPMERAYHIDLGFDLLDEPIRLRPWHRVLWPVTEPLSDARQRQLRAAIEQGIPLAPAPWRLLAEALGISSDQVRNQLANWLESGVIKRLGLVVNHHRLGFVHNAMVVWNVADEQADAAGQMIAATGLVSLCYRRRRAPGWPNNLYCMIHSRSRQQALQRIDFLRELPGLSTPTVLFCAKQYKQKGGSFVALGN